MIEVVHTGASSLAAVKIRWQGEEIVGALGGEARRFEDRAGEAFVRSGSALLVQTEPAAALLSNVWSTIWINLRAIGGHIAEAWKYFLGLKDRPASDQHQLTAAEREVLKQEVMQSVLKDLEAMGIVSLETASSGVVVIPTTSSTTLNDRRKELIKNSFSDNVKVTLDPDGRSGTVEPMIPGLKGEKYFFVIPATDKK